MKTNGADRLFSKMTDREYAEMADLPEDRIYSAEEDGIDEDKDNEYYKNRIDKAYGLTDNKISRN